jgi:hypothetical protein
MPNATARFGICFSTRGVRTNPGQITLVLCRNWRLPCNAPSPCRDAATPARAWHVWQAGSRCKKGPVQMDGQLRQILGFCGGLSFKGMS